MNKFDKRINRWALIKNVSTLATVYTNHDHMSSMMLF